MILVLGIIGISLFFIFLLANKYIFVYKKEHFVKTKTGRICGEFNDTCRLNQYNVSSCCQGYYCGRKLGKFRSRVCIPINNISNATSWKSLDNNSLEVINYPEKPTGVEKDQIHNVDMGSEMPEEEEEELYYELFLALADNIAAITTGKLYEQKESSKNNYSLNKDQYKQIILKYQQIYKNTLNYLTNYINQRYKQNKANRKNVEKDYFIIINNNQQLLDESFIEKYRTLLQLD